MNKNWIIAVGGLFVLTGFLPPSTIDRFFVQQAIGWGILVFILSGVIFHRYGAWAALPFAYFATYALFDYLFPVITFDRLGPMGAAQWGSTTAGSLATLLLFAATGVSVSKKYLSLLVPLLAFMALADSIVMILRFGIFGADQACWISTHPSVDGSFVACLIPFFFPYLDPGHEKYNPGFEILLAVMLMVMACLVSHSSTAVVGVFVGPMAYIFARKGWKSLIALIPIGLCAVMISHVILLNKLLQDDGRYHVWQMGLAFFKTQNKWVGAGPGTYFLYGPALQIIDNQGRPDHHDIFLWMHNDWLQMLFEGGIAGLSSILLLFMGMLVRAWRKPYIFSMCICYGFIGLTQMPLHLFFLQLLGFSLLVAAFDASPSLFGSYDLPTPNDLQSNKWGDFSYRALSARRKVSSPTHSGPL